MKRFKNGRAFVFRYAVKLQFPPFSNPPPRVLFILPSFFLSLFLLLFRSPFINYNEPGEGGNKPVKNPIIVESFVSAFILFPFNLPRCLTANQMYLEYRCLWCAEFAIFLNQPGKKIISCSCSPKFITHSVCLISRKLSDRMAIRIDFEGKKLMRWKGNELKYQIWPVQLSNETFFERNKRAIFTREQNSRLEKSTPLKKKNV